MFFVVGVELYSRSQRTLTSNTSNVKQIRIVPNNRAKKVRKVPKSKRKVQKSKRKLPKAEKEYHLL